MLDEEFKEVEPNVGYNILNVEVNDDMIDVDDNVDMGNPLSINSKRNDIDVELDEE